MTGALLGILAASALGSVHCAAMCGGFVCWYAGDAPRNAGDARLLRAHARYNVGRLASYLLLGAVAGALGAGVTSLGGLAGVSHAAAIVAGTLMIAWAVGRLGALRGLPAGAVTVPPAWQRLVARGLDRVRDQPVGVRAALMGLVTALLPCGWLYVFVATAGGTGSSIDAMVVMAVFWLGSVPALVAVGVGAQQVLGSLREKLPALSAVVVLVIGLLAVTGRLTMNLGALAHGH